MPIEHQSLAIPGWEKGVNLSFDPTLSEQGEVVEAVNIMFDDRGAARKRRGFTTGWWLDTKEPATMNGVWEIFVGRFQYNSSGADTNYYIVIDNDGRVFTFGSVSSGLDRSATAPNVTLSDYTDQYYYARVQLASMGTSMFMTTARTAHDPYEITYSGGVFTYTAITDNTLDGGANEFPNARFLVNKHNRLFAANLYSGSTHYPNRIWWSNVNTPKTWGANSWIDVDPDDGDEIHGFISLGDRLMIFKARSIWILSGTDPSSFSLYQLDDKKGLRWTDTLAVGEEKLYWFDPITGAWTFDGLDIKPIDDPVRDSILRNYNLDYEYTTHAFFFQGNYWLSVSDYRNSGTTNWRPSRTYIYNTNTGSWSFHRMGFTSSAYLSATAYVGGLAFPDNTAKTPEHVYVLTENKNYSLQEPTYYLDNGERYTSYFITPWIVFGENFSFESRIDAMSLISTYYGGPGHGGDRPLKMKFYVDFDSTTPIAEQTFYMNSRWNRIAYPSNTSGHADDRHWNSVAIKFTDEDRSDKGYPWQVNYVDILYHTRPRGRVPQGGEA